MPIEHQELPGPPGLPLLGNLHQVKFPQLHTWFEKQATEYGDVFKVKLGPEKLTVIARPEICYQKTQKWKIM